MKLSNLFRYKLSLVYISDRVIYSIGEFYLFTRIFTKHDSFFKEPNILNCYWAGFIAADGYVRNKPIQLGITLSIKDKDHLNKFKEDINYTGPIHDRKIKRVYKEQEIVGEFVNLTICSSQEILFDLFNNFNIVPRKSSVLQPPNLESLNLKLAFIIGLIDGDGTIYVDSNGRLQISIVGTYEITSWICNIFNKLIPSKNKHIAKAKLRTDRGSFNHATYKITGYRAEAIFKILQQIDVPKLNRKWNFVIPEKSSYNRGKTRKSRKSLIS